MALFNISHTTRYSYSHNIFDSKNIIKMFPIEDEFTILKSQFVTYNGYTDMKFNKDGFGNKIGFFTLYGYHNFLNIISTSHIETKYHNVFDEALASQSSWEHYAHFALDNSFRLFLNPKDFSVFNELSSEAFALKPYSYSPLNFILVLNQYIFNNYQYLPNTTLVTTPIWEVWRNRCGVCQDFSLVMIDMLRIVGIPARYVSGYICPNHTGMRGDGATHAWVEAFLPSYGWIGVDPTNNVVVSDKHVRVAVGRDYDDVSPLIGQFSGFASQQLQVSVVVGYEEESYTSNLNAAQLALV